MPVLLLFVYCISDKVIDPKSDNTETEWIRNFAPPEAQTRTNRPAHEGRWLFQLVTKSGVPIKFARRVDVGSACLDIRQSPKTDVRVFDIKSNLSRPVYS